MYERYLVEAAIIVLPFVVLALICYAPALYAMTRAKCSRKRFLQILEQLTPTMEWCRIVETRQLGLGEEPDTSISFEQALMHLEVATASTMQLMCSTTT